MKILHKKISLPFHAVIALWCLIALAIVATFSLSMAILLNYISPPTRPIPDPHFNVIRMTIISSDCILIALWKLSTFSRGDLVALLRREGVQVKRRNLLFILLTSWFWSYPQGRFGNSYVISRILGAYHLPLLIETNDKHLNRAEITPVSIQKDTIDLVSAIETPFKLREEVFIARSERIIPRTESNEINRILISVLNDISDFRARLIIDGHFLRLSILASPWLGGRYEKRVIAGFELFKQLDQALREEYPSRPLLDLETKWDASQKQFEIIRATT